MYHTYATVKDNFCKRMCKLYTGIDSLILQFVTRDFY